MAIDIKHSLTMAELMLVIKVQARWRGMIARRKMKGQIYSAGMVDHDYDENNLNYDN
jgi:hypothetical protein